MRTFEELNDLIRAFQPSRALLTALELDVFEAIGEGATAEKVAAAAGADPRATGMLLNALVALGALTKQADTFHNTAVTARHFRRGSPDDSRAALLHTANLWRRWSTLTDCVLAGTGLTRPDPPEVDAARIHAFIAAMHRNASERAPHVLDALDLSGVRRVLDLGGGSGAYAIAFAKAQPGLRAEVLDLPDVVGLTRGYAEAAGVADRVSAREGDIGQQSYGRGFDLVWISQICHMMGPDENRAMLRKARAALAPGGRVAIQEFLLDPDRAGPPQAALFALNMLVGTGRGNAYTEGDVCGWMREAGLADVAGVRLPGSTGLVVGRVGG